MISNPYPLRVLRPDEVPCSKELTNRLRAWQLVYERHTVPTVPQGMSIFVNQADAVAFFETGKELTEVLQAQWATTGTSSTTPSPRIPLGGLGWSADGSQGAWTTA